MPPVEPPGVGAQQPLHARHQIRLRGFNNQVEMIAHKTKGMNLPAGLGARLTERGDETLAIFIIKEDGFAPISTIHQVIEGTLVFYAQLAGHALTLGRESAHSQEPTPLLFRTDTFSTSGGQCLAALADRRSGGAAGTHAAGERGRRVWPG